MKYLLADVYRMTHQLIKNRQIATLISILYVSVLAFFILHAIVALLSGVVPAAAEILFINKAIRIGVFAAIIGAFYLLMPPQKLIKREKERTIRYGAIFIYTGCALFCIFYLLFQSHFK